MSGSGKTAEDGSGPVGGGGGGGVGGESQLQPLLESDARSVGGSSAHTGLPSVVEHWEFPGWGEHRELAPSPAVLRDIAERLHKPHPKLGQWMATAICGNDITSSCLYTAGLVIASAGHLAPFALLFVVLVLYLFRKIYGEVVSALPLNGGAYNALLNTTSKSTASVAACLAILAYIATGVVSGTEACHYLKRVLPGMNVYWATIGLLFVFAVLCFMGLTESAVVALIIFVMHLITLTVLCVISAVFAFQHMENFERNWRFDLPTVTVLGKEQKGTVTTALLFGFASAMLGISGFETSSQFVEEQADGVFVKTLRNMWVAVSIFNPTLAFLYLGVVVQPEQLTPEQANTVLATMAHHAGGQWLEYWVSVDAFVVLSGAVLTSYVGVTGLIRRMAMDRCLPQFLLAENSWRKTNHSIIFGFFFVSSSLFTLLGGEVTTLSGVYSLSFLGVMGLFAFACMLLKYKRPGLPRSVRTSWAGAVIALIFVLITMVGNVVLRQSVLTYFVLYFGSVMGIVAVMFLRIRILKLLVRCTRAHRLLPSNGTRRRGWLLRAIQEVNETPYVFLCKRDRLAVMNKVVLYVRENELTHKLLVVHVHAENEPPPQEFAQHVRILDEIYPKIKIDFVAVKGTFNPAMVDWLSQELEVPKNMMFIACPDDKFPHELAAFGGVRVVTH